MLNDEIVPYRWSDAEIVQGLNEGQVRALQLRPDLYRETDIVFLTPGVLQDAQEVSNSEIIDFESVITNAAGNFVSPVAFEEMRAFLRGWPNAPADANVTQFARKPGHRTQFYVYPPQPAAPGRVEIQFTPKPADISATTSSVLPGEFSPALDYYAVFFVLRKDMEKADVAALATTSIDQFNLILGVAPNASSA